MSIGYRARRFITRAFYFTPLLLVMAADARGATATKTVYSQSSNKELKQKALQLVTSIREVVHAYNKKDREMLAEYDRQTSPGSTAASAKALRDRWMKETDDLHDSMMRRYKEQYWSDAILLCGEILRRLPKQNRQANILPLYQHPTNVLGVQAVADHLELIARSLPN